MKLSMTGLTDFYLVYILTVYVSLDVLFSLLTVGLNELSYIMASKVGGSVKRKDVHLSVGKKLELIKKLKWKHYD